MMIDGLGVLIFVLTGVVISFVADLYWIDILIFALWYAYLCVTWNIVGGFAGAFTFAHPIYVAIGGYTSTLLAIHLGLTPWLGMFAGMALAASLALVLAWINFRRQLPHLTYALITLAMTFIGVIVLRSTPALGGSEGLFILRADDPSQFKFFDKTTYFYIILAAVGLLIAFVAWLRRSRIGLKLAALRDNPNAAMMLGVNRLHMLLLASGLSAGLGALAGTFYAQYLFVIDPSVAGSHLAVEIILFTALGGIGTVWGPVFGALLLVTVSRTLNAEFVDVTGMGQVVYGLLIVVVLVALKEGVVTFAQQVLGARARRTQRGAREAK